MPKKSRFPIGTSKIKISKNDPRILADISVPHLNFVLFLFSSLFYRNRPFQQAIARVSVMSRSILFSDLKFVNIEIWTNFGPDYIPKMNQLWKTEIYKFKSKPPWNYSTRWEASLWICSHFVEGCMHSAFMLLLVKFVVFWCLT